MFKGCYLAAAAVITVEFVGCCEKVYESEQRVPLLLYLAALPQRANYSVKIYE